MCAAGDFPSSSSSSGDRSCASAPPTPRVAAGFLKDSPLVRADKELGRGFQDILDRVFLREDLERGLQSLLAAFSDFGQTAPFPHPIAGRRAVAFRLPLTRRLPSTPVAPEGPPWDHAAWISSTHAAIDDGELAVAI